MEHQEDTQPKHRNSLWMQQDVYQKTQVDGVTVDVNYFKAIVNPGAPNQVVINRPQLTYAEILHDIISEMPNKRISTVNIYEKVVEIYPYFKYATARWRNSINSVLSRNTQFRSVTYHDERGLPDRYWTIAEPNNENDNKMLLENIISGANNSVPITSPSPSSQHHQQPMSTSPHLHSMNINAQQLHSMQLNNGAPVSGVRPLQHLQDTPPYLMQNDFVDFCSRALGVNYSDICNNEEKLGMAYNQYILYMNGVRNSTASMQSPYARTKYAPPPPNMMSTNPYVNLDWSPGQIPATRPPSNVGNDPTNNPPQFQYPAVGQNLQQYMRYIPTNQDQQLPSTNTSSNTMNDSVGMNNIYPDYTHPTEPNSGQFGIANTMGPSMAFPNYGNYRLVDEQQMQQFFPSNPLPTSYSKENLAQRNSINMSPLPTAPNNGSLQQHQQAQYHHQQQIAVGPHSNYPPLSQISTNANQNSHLDMSNPLKNNSLVDNNFDIGDTYNYDPNNSTDMSNQIVDR